MTAPSTFSCAVGVRISEADTPRLYTLLRRSLSDVGLSPYPTKNKYQRARPFTVIADQPLAGVPFLVLVALAAGLAALVADSLPALRATVREGDS